MGKKVRYLLVLLMLFLTVNLVLGVWILGKRYYVWYGGVETCSKDISEKHSVVNRECGYIVDLEIGGRVYGGVLWDVRRVKERYFVAVGFKDLVRWYYLGEGDAKAEVMISFPKIVQNEIQSGQSRKFIKVKLDDSGVNELEKYLGSYIRFVVAGDNVVKKMVQSSYDDVGNDISRRQHEKFVSYESRCMNIGKLGSILMFCKPYATGFQIYR